MMRKLIWFTAGMITLAIVFSASVILFLTTQVAGFSTREKPSAMERWAAQRFRALAVPKSAKSRSNPVAESVEVLASPRAHWADHCASCHSNNGSGDVEMGKHLYPPAPDMRQLATQTLTDGELFYIIQNGIRFTGMPAWGSGTSQDEEDSWKLVRFIRHLPKLTPEEEQEMKELNPKSPDELKEEQEEREFLNGGEPNEQTHHH
jgi:mono/diheme cytochrome c family protein